MTKARAFLFLNIAFLGGVSLKSYVSNPVVFAIGFFVFISFLWLLAIRQGGGDISKILILFGIFLAVTAGAVRFATHQETRLYSLSPFQGEQVAVEGMILEPPQVFPQSQRLRIGIERLTYSEAIAHPKGEVLITLRRFPEYTFGQKVKASGKLEPLLRAKELAGWIMSYPEVLAIGQGNTFLRNYLFRIREKFVGGLNLSLPEPYAALGRGLLLGERSSFGKELTDNFRNSGLSHIVALSGYNITVVASNVMKFLRWFALSTGTTFWVASLSIILFTIVTGAQASTVRAAIMGLLVLVAQREGRIYRMGNALAFAGALMVLIQPTALRFDVGFQLSFLATLGLIYFAPRLVQYFQWLPETFSLREIVVQTFATQLMVLPLLIGYFGQLSLLGTLANILVLPLVPLTMFLAFISGLTGILFLPLGTALGLIARLFLEWEVVVAKFFSSLEFSLLRFSLPDIILIVLGACYYGFIAWFIVRSRRQITSYAKET